MTSPVPILDGHVDLNYHLQSGAGLRCWQELADGPLQPRAIHEGSVELLVCALYCSDRFNGTSAWGHLREQLQFATRAGEGLLPVRRRGDLERLVPGEFPGQLWLIENADALLEADLDVLEAAGVRIAGLTHAGRNRLADGNGVAHPGGLTDKGRILLANLAARGWILDVAHLAPPGLREALDLYPGPVMCSHTGLRRFCDRVRNLNVVTLREIAARGGVIGLSLAPEMLNGTAHAGVAEVVAQLDWLVEMVGPGGTALGSDYGGFPGNCSGLDDYRDWGRIAEGLAQRGYTDETITALLGGSWRRFYARVLPD